MANDAASSVFARMCGMPKVSRRMVESEAKSPKAGSAEIVRKRIRLRKTRLMSAIVRQIQRMEAQRDAVRRTQSTTSPSAANATSWTLVGPTPSKAGSTANFPNNAGMVQAMAVDPRDGKVVYAGTNGGGIWKTTDGG